MDAENPVDAAAPPAAGDAGTRPEGLPEALWDAASGTVRIEALLESYLELMRGASGPPPAAEAAAADPDAASFSEAAPADMPPAQPEDYVIQPPHALIEPDPELNARLRGAGLTQVQAQLVYDLAAERLLPIVLDMVSEVEARQHLDRLQRHFGGVESWQHTASQIRSWATAHLVPELYAALATSYEGVLALQRMMQASEPELIGAGDPAAAPPDEGMLTEMMRDERYWRQRDPEFVARVTAGFRRLYPD